MISLWKGYCQVFIRSAKMRMRSGVDQIVFTNSDTIDAQNITDIKCEPGGCEGKVEDVKPQLCELASTSKHCVATTSRSFNTDHDYLLPESSGPGPSTSTSNATEVEDMQPEEQLFCNDVKPCVDELSNRIEIKVVKKAITSIEADALVNAVDSELKSDEDSILTAGGPKMQKELEEVKETLPRGGPLDGYCLATGPYGIENCQAVFHTVVPKLSESPNRMEEYLLRSCYLNCLAAGEENGFTKMAFPVLGLHNQKTPRFSILIAVHSALLHLQLNSNPRLKEIIFVASDDLIYESFKFILEGKSEMEVSVETAQPVRTRLERRNVRNRLHMHVSPVPGLPFSVGSFVLKWINDAERKRVMRLAQSTPEIPTTSRQKGRKIKKSEAEKSEEKRFQSALRLRELRKNEEYRKLEKERMSTPEYREKVAARTRKRREQRRMEGYSYSPEQLEKRRLKSAARMRMLRNNEEWRKREKERRTDPEFRARVAARKRARRAERKREIEQFDAVNPHAEGQAEQILANVLANEFKILPDISSSS